MDGSVNVQRICNGTKFLNAPLPSPSLPTKDGSDGSTSNGPAIGPIVGGAVGGVLALAAIVAGTVFYVKRKRADDAKKAVAGPEILVYNPDLDNGTGPKVVVGQTPDEIVVYDPARDGTAPKVLPAAP
ncbi:hypothetical protein HK104_006003 [Borealophlyctis nickersoniae]|nr:hypothetical protein HK104_006003 [Borealophlyctis nickersoniae]